MTIPVSIYVENIDEVIAEYTHIQLERASSATGTFALIHTFALVSGLRSYTHEDDTNLTAPWYRYRYQNQDTGGTSEWTAPFRPQGTRLVELRIEVAIEAGAGFRSVTTDTDPANKHHLFDERLGDSGVDGSFLQGAWVYRPDANVNGDKLRRIDLYSTTDTYFELTRAYASEPDTGEEYHVFNLLPPVDAPGNSLSYDRVIRNALMNAWYEDEIIVATGTDDYTDRFDVSAWLPYIKQATQVINRRRTDDAVFEQDMGRNGHWWKIEPNGRLGAELILSRGPSEDDELVVMTNRVDADIYADDDLTLCPFDLAVKASVSELFQAMTLMQPGKYVGELAAAQARYDQIRDRYVVRERVLGL